MRIKTLSLSNFLMHRGSSLACNQVNWIIGREKQGKSSILEALQTTFWRRPTYFNDKGEGIEYLIRNGERKAVIVAETDRGDLLRASIPSDGKDNNLTGITGFDSDTIKACLRCGWVLKLNETDQKKFFQDLVLEELTLQQIGELLNTFDERFPDLGNRFLQYVEGEGLHTNDFDALLRCAESGRKEAKKILQKLETQEPPSVPEILKKVTEKEIAKAEKQHEEAIKKLQTAEDRVRDAQDIYNQKLSDWKSLEFSHAQVKREFAEAEAEVNRATSAVVPVPNGSLKTIEKGLAELEESITDNQKEIDRVTSGTGECPPGQCARKILKTLTEFSRKFQAEKAKFLDDAKKFTAQSNQAALSAQAAKAAEERWERAKKRYGELKELTPQPEPPDISKSNIESLKAQLHMFKTSVSQMRNDFANCQKAAEIEKQITAHNNEVQEYRQQVEIFEAICSALGTKGIKMQMLEQRLSEFLGEVNQGLKAFGFTMKIDLDPWRIWIDAGDGYGWVTVLSESTKSRSSIPLQVAIAKRRGFPCVGIDNHELGPELRSVLFRYLLTVPVQSFVISTLDEFDDDGKLIIPEHPGTENVSIFYIESGQVMEIKPAAEIAAA